MAIFEQINKKDVWLVNKDIKIYSAPFVIRERENKIIKRYLYAHTRKAKNLKLSLILLY